MSDYRKLRVWKKSHELTLKIYHVTKNFPQSEVYGLTSQMRRAASSIPMNIAEGCGIIHKKEFIRYLGIARGSSAELEYQIFLCKDLQYINKGEYEIIYKMIKEIQQMINGLIKSLRM